ncbi:MAG: amino acid ABC transporter permease [Actinomycetota bacterium]
MSEVAIPAPPRSPLWRNVRFLRIVGQVVFVVLIVFVLREMYLNAAFNLGERGRELSLDYLDNRAGFGIKESILNYGANQPFYRAFMVAATNAMLVAALGIVLATILGLFVGIARLTPNWLVSRIAQVYVEVLRNTPLLVQVIFWWAAVILSIPRIENSISVGSIIFISNRGTAIPALRGGNDFGLWSLFVLAGLAAAVAGWRWRTRIHEQTGRPHYRVLTALGIVILLAGTGYFVLGDAFHIEFPELGRFNYAGGLQMSPEFAGILIALVVYTSTFIGEIVRGSILAVSKGQKEAAQALGLRAAQQTRLVVLPQALRIAIPPITNQYLNLWKNTSLAFAIGYPEIINISTTMINQAGHELETFSLVVLTYLVTSLLISAVMNFFNRFVALRGSA